MVGVPFFSGLSSLAFLGVVPVPVAVAVPLLSPPFFKPNLTSAASRSESVRVAVGSVGFRFWRQLYKSRSSRKIDSQTVFSRE